MDAARTNKARINGDTDGKRIVQISPVEALRLAMIQHVVFGNIQNCPRNIARSPPRPIFHFGTHDDDLMRNIERNDCDGHTRGENGVGGIGMADNILRPLLLSGRSSGSGLVVFLGLLGGVAAFGFVGLILGPIVLMVAGTLLDAFAED